MSICSIPIYFIFVWCWYAIQTMILFGTRSVYWIKNDNPIHYTTYFMDHEINNNITALYVLCLSNVTKSFIEKYFRLFWAYKRKVFLYKNNNNRLFVSCWKKLNKVNTQCWKSYIYIAHTLVKKKLKFTRSKVKKKVKILYVIIIILLYVYKYVFMKGSYGLVALKMLMLCIFNVLSKFSDENH